MSGLGSENIGFRLYQSCDNMGSVVRVSVFVLRWCGLYRGKWVVDWVMICKGGVMSLCVVSLESLCRWQVSLYRSRRISAHLRCT